MHWRQEQLSLRMALVTASHHSFDRVHAEHVAPRSQKTGTRAGEGEVHEKHDGPRAQERPLPGTRPERLSDAQEPQGVLEHSCPACGAPSLSMRVLADRAADGVDEAALSFLLWRALEDKRKEEQLAKEKEEERKQKVLDSLEQKLQQLLHESSSSSVQRRKRKKRRKRRLPRAPRP